MTTPTKMSVKFDIIDVEKMTCQIKGLQDYHNFVPTTVPAPHVLDELVTLVSGKYPLHDYKDTIAYAAHKYVFAKADGTKFSGTLDGFTYDCTFDGQGKNLGTPAVWVLLD